MSIYEYIYDLLGRFKAEKEGSKEEPISQLNELLQICFKSIFMVVLLRYLFFGSDYGIGVTE